MIYSGLHLGHECHRGVLQLDGQDAISARRKASESWSARTTLVDTAAVFEIGFCGTGAYEDDALMLASLPAWQHTRSTRRA